MCHSHNALESLRKTSEAFQRITRTVHDIWRTAHAIWGTVQVDLGRKLGTASLLLHKGSGQILPVSSGKKTVKVSWVQQGLQSVGWQSGCGFELWSWRVADCSESFRWHFLAEVVVWAGGIWLRLLKAPGIYISPSNIIKSAAVPFG